MSKLLKLLRSKQIQPATAVLPQGNQKLWIKCAGVLLLFWAAIYLPYLRTSPRWYGDEFVSLIAGDSIFHGTFANRALRYSFFSGFTNYQPWGCFLFALSSHLFGGGILGARLLSAFLGFLTALAAFHLLFRRGLILQGMAAALIIMGAPEAVVHFRWVYPHAFVGLGVVVIGLLLDVPRTPRRDWLIGLGCACAALGHLLVVHVTLAALIVRWRHPGSWLRIAIPPGVVLLLSLAFGYLISGHQLISDIGEVGLQYTSHNEGTGWLLKLQTFWTFFSWDWLHVLYVAGLMALLWHRRWALVCFASLVSFAVIQNRPELPVFYYQAMIFTPLLGVCLACGLQLLYEKALQLDPDLLRNRTVHICLAAIIPAILVVQGVHSSLSGKIISRNDPWVAPSTSDLEITAAWVNSQTEKNDLVVAFWDLGWMLKGRWTDMMQCAVWQYGTCPEFYKRNREQAEFLFPANLRDARYVVVGPLDLRWCYGQGTIPRLLQEVELEKWPRVASSTTTIVLANPRFLTPSANKH